MGCGGESSAPASTTPPASPGGYLSATDLQRQVGNAFRKGLYRVAVMSQRDEDAKDLGQPLPTGVVRSVRCAPGSGTPGAGGAWTWSCQVAWRGVAGGAQETRYRVTLRTGLCFAAGATPTRGPRYDATVRTYAQDPLNTLVSVRRGC